ncbi:MAG: 50S ribosomal protein L1 [Candidatus Moraniibacteriota bacterium]|nr:MAG: 50S ribosomal protein L1 [Candidatus Moranbacteria bacterium]
MQHGKKYRAAAEKIEEGKVFTIAEAVAFLQAHKTAKFDESVEMHFKLGISAKKNDENVRGTVVLPHGTGRTQKVAVVTSTKLKEAQDAGAALAGGEELVAQIKEGKVNPGTHFDLVLATPEMMPKLATVAKILGPKGMMPSPKNETVTQKIAETVEMLQKGKKASYKNDDSGNIHQVVGKLSFTAAALEENIAMFTDAIQKGKPEGLKGRFILSMTLSSTMGPGLRITK